MDADVIVVGAGHNGLVCAAYLARAGIDTLLLEARDDVGGVASTVTDIGARFNVCNCDHTIVRAMPIADELELAAHGLRYLENEAGSVHRFHDGSAPWMFFHEVDRHLDALAATHPGQVERYRRYLDDALPVAELLLDIARTTPTTPRILGRVAGRRAGAAARLVGWARRSAGDVLAEYFDDWHMTMPGISTGPTVWGAPPSAPGTGAAAALYATRHVVKSGRPAGGSGALTDAIRRSFEAAGGRVRCGARVEALLVRDGAADGVRLVDGTVLRAPAVVAATDPRAVMLEWLTAVPCAARRAVARERSRAVPDGYESKVDAVLRRVPRFRRSTLDDVVPDVDQLGPTNVVAPSPDELAEAHRLRSEGRVAARPTLLVNVPTVLDDAMQPVPGQHVLSVEVLFTPYELAGGWPGSREPERWLELVDDLMEPGTLDIERWRAMTPDRYEREFSLARGHTPSFSATPVAVLLGRDRPHTRYRTPIQGLYLTGAGTFPGAGITGAPGRNAAAVVRHDVLGAGRPVAAIRRRLATRWAS